jgi:hypothetical protein
VDLALADCQTGFEINQPVSGCAIKSVEGTSPQSFRLDQIDQRLRAGDFLLTNTRSKTRQKEKILFYSRFYKKCELLSYHKQLAFFFKIYAFYEFS